MNVLKDMTIGIHATKMVLFADCKRSCRTNESRLSARQEAQDYLNFTNTFLGEPQSSGLIIETLLKNLHQGKYGRLEDANLTFSDVRASANLFVEVNI